MKQSLKIGSIAGIKITVHWTFLILIAWIIISGIKQDGSIPNAMYSVAFILLLFVCITLHELGHALTAKHFHVSTKSIILLPIGGVAQMDRIPEKPKEELLIALAGPMVNVVIAGMLGLYVYFVMDVESVIRMTYINGDSFLFFLFIANISLALFNLLPAFPMDGGRVLRALLSMKLKREKATAIAASIGQGMAILFVLAGIFANPFLILAGIFIYLGAQAEAEFTAIHTVLKNYRAKDILMKNIMVVRPDDSLEQAVQSLLNGQGKDLVVAENGQALGSLGRDVIMKAIKEKGPAQPVKNSMEKTFSSFSPDTPLDEIYSYLASGKNSIAAIVDSGKLAGIIDLENILELVMLRKALEKNNIKTELIHS